MKKLIILFFILVSKQSFSQTVPVGQTVTEDMLRILQLTGKIDAAQSLSARPFFYNKTITRNDLLNLIDSGNDIQLAQKSFANNQIQLVVLPVTFVTKFNSHHPYGWNDAGMQMAKGLQTMISAGVHAKAGPLSIQLQPEFYYTANPSYKTTAEYGYNSGKSYSKLFAGQSSIRLNAGPISIGASTENLWWGPGQFSSLLMSNNAPGFQHLTFNTTRPLKTPIGSFEWQLVVGKLNEDTSRGFENKMLKPFNPKNTWRYFSGIVITYQPSFMPNFFLGLTRTEHLYNTDQNKKTGFINKYLPVFAGASPSANSDTISIPSDGAFSFFGRWILPKIHAEFYIEYGYNDFKQNIRDFFTNANHSSAYIAGFKKVITLKNNQLVDVAGEITQMAQTTSYVVRNSGNWYEHFKILQGYTYQNQIMGAGSGFGNNVQTLQVKKINGFNSLGVRFQRIQQNPKRTSGGLPTIGMANIQWNDMALGFLAQKKFKKLLLNGEVQFVNSKNFGWQKGNAFNLFAMVDCIYFF